MSGERRATHWRALGIAAALALLPWVAWRAVLALELLGWDAFPLIAANRVESAADLGRVLTSELMGGRYPLGHYWRPLVHASFALDHALWGLDPTGYHATDLAVLSGATLALFALARRLLSGGVAATLAALAFALHPVHFEILQAPARRADALCAAFTVLALVLVAARPARSFGAALAVLGALAAKETGAVAAPALFVLAACTSGERGGRARWTHAARVAWPAFAATVLWFGVRALVLGGMGGGATFELGNSLARAPLVVVGYGSGVFGLRRAGLSADAANLAFAGLALTVAVLAVAAQLRARRAAALAAEERADRHASRAPLAVAGFLTLWFAGLALITGTTGVDRAWYELPFLPIHALFVGWLFELGCAAWRARWFVLAGPALALACAAFGADLAHSPLAVRRDDLERASASSRAFLERFNAEVGAAAPGGIVRLAGFPVAERSGGRATDARAQEVTVFAPYSIAAYAELTLPHKRVRPVLAGARLERPAADEIVVVLAR